MKQSKSRAQKTQGVPMHVADAGKIVLGAGVRLPTLGASARGDGNARPSTNSRPAAECKNA